MTSTLAHPKSIRAVLAADPHLGAGNVVTRLLAHGADPAGPGLTFDAPVDGHAAWEPFTLGQLHDAIAARAAWLHQHGVGWRDPVAIYTDSAADHVLTFMACNWLGAIPAVLNGHVKPEIAAEYLRRLRAVGYLTDATRKAALAGLDTGTALLGELSELHTANAGDAPPPYRHHPDDPIAITHSSGTTRTPAAVVHSHHTLFAATRMIRLSVPRAQGTERVLCALPAPHTAGILAVNQALCNRAELLFLSKQDDGALILDAIERWRPTGVFGFAVTWAELARYDLSQRDMSSVAIWFNTGDCAHEAHVRRLVAVGGHDTVTRDGVVRVPGSSFIDGIGSTEMGHSAFHLTHRTDTDRYGRCVGKPHVFAEVRILDMATGDELPVGQVGPLGLKSPTLALGYWNDSVATYRNRFAGYYLTGDLMYRDEQGYYYHMDRQVDAVDLGGGAWLYTAMSEERILATCPEVRDCTLVAVHRADGSAVTDVLLLLREGADPATDRSAQIASALGAQVAATLRKIVNVKDDDLIVGPTGKVRKFLMRERYLAELKREQV